MSHYNVLNLSTSCSQKEIGHAYRSLSKLYHPDKQEGQASLEKFQAIAAAYAILNDPVLRSDYDQQIAPVKMVHLNLNHIYNGVTRSLSIGSQGEEVCITFPPSQSVTKLQQKQKFLDSNGQTFLIQIVEQGYMGCVRASPYSYDILFQRDISIGQALAGMSQPLILPDHSCYQLDTSSQLMQPDGIWQKIIPNRGMLNLETNQRGHLIIRLIAKFPTQRLTLQQLAFIKAAKI